MLQTHRPELARLQYLATGWSRIGELPKTPGVYEVCACLDRPTYCKWDGQNWLSLKVSIQAASEATEVSWMQNRLWKSIQGDNKLSYVWWYQGKKHVATDVAHADRLREIGAYVTATFEPDLVESTEDLNV